MNSAQFRKLQTALEVQTPVLRKHLRQAAEAEQASQPRATRKPRKKQEKAIEIPESYELVVTCRDEADQRSVYERLAADGYQCRVLTL